MDFLQSRLVDMGVDLCGRDARMAQHLLDLTQVSPAREQVGGEAMAQRVWTDRNRRAGA